MKLRAIQPIAVLLMNIAIVTPVMAQTPIRSQTTEINGIQMHLWVVPNGDHVPITGANASRFADITLEFLSARGSE